MTSRIGSGGPDLPSQAPSIQDHALLRPIAKGSYGEVWLARSVTGAYRAVKVVYQRSFESPRPFAREFTGIKNFEPVSRSHEGLMDILQVGLNSEAGYFYYVMELADDLNTGSEIDPETYVPNTLASHLRDGEPLPLSECRRLGLALSSALTHLHKQGLVHRDIKPSNIIFAQGVPKLADIGLVAGLDDARSFVGTEGYIPPEGPGSAQADIYSLGKVLYEISTGQDRHEFPKLPAHFRDGAQIEEFRELNEVLIRACHTDPGSRYQSADEVYGDLLLLQGGKSLRRLRVLERRFKFAGKAAVFAGILLLIGAAGVLQFNREQKRSAEIRQRAVGNFVANGTKYLEEGNLLASLPWFVAALRLDRGSPEEDTHRLRIHAVLSHAPKLLQMYFQNSPINGVAWDPQRSLFALASASGEIHLWDPATGRVEKTLRGHTAEVEKVAFSDDGKWLASAGDDGKALIWNMQTYLPEIELPHSFQVNSVQFDHDATRVVTAGNDPHARVWQRNTGQLLMTLTNAVHQLWFASFSPDARYVATAGDPQTSVWDLLAGRQTVLPLEKDVTYSACFSPDCQYLVTASYQHRAQVWNLKNLELAVKFDRHTQGVLSSKFSSDGKAVVSASLDGTACVWDPRTGRPLAAPLVHSGRVLDAAFGRNSREVMTVCWDGTGRLWRLEDVRDLPSFHPGVYSLDGAFSLTQKPTQLIIRSTAPERVVTTIASFPSDLTNFVWAPGGAAFVATTPFSDGHNQQFQVWNVRTAKPLSPLLSAPASLNHMAVRGDGAQFLTVNGPDVHVWRSATGHAEGPPLHHPASVKSALFLSDKDRSVLAVSGSNVFLWKTAEFTGSPLIIQNRNLVSSITPSPDGRFVVVGTSDDTYRECEGQVFEVKTGSPIGARLLHRDGILAAAFSPDGRKVVTASEDFSAIVWDSHTGQQLTPPLRHTDQVVAVTVSANNHWIATVSLDNLVRLWDANNGEALSPPIPFPRAVMDVSFVSDDNWLVVKGAPKGAWVYPLPRDPRPVADLALVAQLLSGQRSYEMRAFRSEDYPPLEVAWARLRAKFGERLGANRPARLEHRSSE